MCQFDKAPAPDLLIHQPVLETILFYRERGREINSTETPINAN